METKSDRAQFGRLVSDSLEKNGNLKRKLPQEPQNGEPVKKAKRRRRNLYSRGVIRKHKKKKPKEPIDGDILQNIKVEPLDECLPEENLDVKLDVTPKKRRKKKKGKHATAGRMTRSEAAGMSLRAGRSLNRRISLDNISSEIPSNIRDDYIQENLLTSKSPSKSRRHTIAKCNVDAEQQESESVASDANFDSASAVSDVNNDVAIEEDSVDDDDEESLAGIDPEHPEVIGSSDTEEDDEEDDDGESVTDENDDETAENAESVSAAENDEGSASLESDFPAERSKEQFKISKDALKNIETESKNVETADKQEIGENDETDSSDTVLRLEMNDDDDGVINKLKDGVSNKDDLSNVAEKKSEKEKKIESDVSNSENHDLTRTKDETMDDSEDKDNHDEEIDKTIETAGSASADKSSEKQEDSAETGDKTDQSQSGVSNNDDIIKDNEESSHHNSNDKKTEKNDNSESATKVEDKVAKDSAPPSSKLDDTINDSSVTLGNGDAKKDAVDKSKVVESCDETNASNESCVETNASNVNEVNDSSTEGAKKSVEVEDSNISSEKDETKDKDSDESLAKSTGISEESSPNNNDINKETESNEMINEADSNKKARETESDNDNDKMETETTAESDKIETETTTESDKDKKKTETGENKPPAMPSLDDILNDVVSGAQILDDIILSVASGRKGSRKSKKQANSFNDIIQSYSKKSDNSTRASVIMKSPRKSTDNPSDFNVDSDTDVENSPRRKFRPTDDSSDHSAPSISDVTKKIEKIKAMVSDITKEFKHKQHKECNCDKDSCDLCTETTSDLKMSLKRKTDSKRGKKKRKRIFTFDDNSDEEEEEVDEVYYVKRRKRASYKPEYLNYIGNLDTQGPRTKKPTKQGVNNIEHMLKKCKPCSVKLVDFLAAANTPFNPRFRFVIGSNRGSQSYESRGIIADVLPLEGINQTNTAEANRTASAYRPRIKKSTYFQCKCCSYKTIQRVVIMDHIYSHVPQLPFRCKLCMMDYRSRSGCIQHIRRIHKGDATMCDVVVKVDETKYFEVKTKSETLAPLQVPQVIAPAPHVHAPTLQPKVWPAIAPEPELTFECVYCMHKSRERSEIQNHVIKNHGSNHGYVCPHCPLVSVPGADGMIRHFKDAHPYLPVVLKGGPGFREKRTTTVIPVTTSTSVVTVTAKTVSVPGVPVPRFNYLPGNFQAYPNSLPQVSVVSQSAPISAVATNPPLPTLRPMLRQPVTVTSTSSGPQPQLRMPPPLVRIGGPPGIARPPTSIIAALKNAIRPQINTSTSVSGNIQLQAQGPKGGFQTFNIQNPSTSVNNQQNAAQTANMMSGHYMFPNGQPLSFPFLFQNGQPQFQMQPNQPGNQIPVPQLSTATSTALVQQPRMSVNNQLRMPAPSSQSSVLNTSQAINIGNNQTNAPQPSSIAKHIYTLEEIRKYEVFNLKPPGQPRYSNTNSLGLPKNYTPGGPGPLYRGPGQYTMVNDG